MLYSAQLKAAYLSGKSLSRVSRDFHLPVDTVKRYLIDMGVVIRKQGPQGPRTTPEHRKAVRQAAQRRKQLRDQERQYGWAPGYLQQLQAKQPTCKICQIPFGDKAPHVDHDHVTGQFRGLLCARCNTGLGLFKDSVDNLQQAITYLQR